MRVPIKRSILIAAAGLWLYPPTVTHQGDDPLGTIQKVPPATMGKCPIGIILHGQTEEMCP